MDVGIGNFTFDLAVVGKKLSFCSHFFSLVKWQLQTLLAVTECALKKHNNNKTKLSPNKKRRKSDLLTIEKEKGITRHIWYIVKL